MAAKEKAPAERPLRVTSLSALKEATGTADPGLQMRLIEQLRDTLWLHSTLSPDRRSDFIQSAFAALSGIKPADEIEGMLAVQMVATHNAAIDCLRRAMIEEQTFEGRNQNLKHAANLLGIYARQLEALNKHRGKGQQKVTVEHVHVEAGAQAVVGSVHTSPAAATDAKSAAPAIEHKPAQTLSTLSGVKRAKAKSKSRTESA